MISDGRGFPFADRFSPEILYTVTQTGTDLSNLETKIEVRGRFFVKKSLGMIQSFLISTGEKQMK
jgi:hypothetical protein